MRKRLLVMSVFLASLFLLMNGISHAWEVPIVVKGDGITDTLYFGTDPVATNGYDTGIDVLAPPPPPSGFYTAFYIGGTFPYLTNDKRSSGDTLVNWTLRTLGDPTTDSISWNPADLPATGDFTLDGQNMRTQSLLVYSGNITKTLTYHITIIPPATIPIIVKGNGTVDTLYFGMDPAATDGYDTGIDVLAPPPPPSGFYTAFYIGGTFPYLTKDMRASDDPHIIWTLRTLGDPTTDSISWHPADIPAGTFLFDTVGLNLNMKTESLAVYTGNKTLYLKYTTAPPPTYTVSGTVGLSDGPPDSSGSIVALDGKADTTDTHGYYAITGVLAGTYDIHVTHTNYYPDSAIGVVVSGNTIRNFTLTKIPPQTYTVDGTVGLSDNPANLSGSIVALDGKADTTDSLGSYAITDVLGGTYNINVTHTGYFPASLTGVVISSDTTFNFSLIRIVRDVGPTALLSPPSDVNAGTTYPVQVRVKNFGTTTETFNVSCTIDGYANIVAVTNLAPSDSVVKDFANWTATSGAFIMQAVTLLTGDANPANDTLGKPVGAEERVVIPTTYELSLSIPNPATNSVRIPYAIPEKSKVEIKVYNIAGKIVRTLKSGVEEPGFKTAIWDMKDTNGNRVPTGTYFYKMQAGKFSAVRKMTVTK